MTVVASVSPPSFDDVCAAFDRIRSTGGNWDYTHPLRDLIKAAAWADIARSAERIAAYTLAGQTPPLGYYDEVIDHLHLAIELLEAHRHADHGDAPPAVGEAKSEYMRSALRRSGERA